MVQTEQTTWARIITLLPNRSATWQETRLLLFFLCGTTLAIGVFWTFVGFWAVLPFSGIEAALVAFILYRVCCGTYQRQVITLTTDRILVQSGMRLPRHSWHLQRDSAGISVEAPSHPMDAPRLKLFDNDCSIEVGNFLNKSDRELALEELRQSGLPVKSYGCLQEKTF